MLRHEQIFNEEGISSMDILKFKHRIAVRGVIIDNEHKVALLELPNINYSGLPGGGLEENESRESAIIRECLEEIGCTIDIIHSLGSTLEVRKSFQLTNESHAFLGRVVGEKCLPSFNGDEDDLEKSLLVRWYPIKEAIRRMDAIPYNEDLYERYCVDRDLIFLRKAYEFIEAL